MDEYDFSHIIAYDMLAKGKAYMDWYKKEEKVWEEFIADVFAGMNDYTADYIDTVVDYWYDGKVVDRYNPAEYINSIDSGGNQTILDNIGLSDEYKLSESGEEYGQTGYNRTRTERLPERVGNQGRGDSGNTENLSDGNSKSKVQNISEKWNGEKRGSTQRSGMESVEVVSQTPSGAFSPGRSRTNGERFLSALRDGDTETARTILNEQAVKNGFVPAHVYHGTLSDDVFTQFESEIGIHWVTPNLDYAMYLLCYYTNS